MNEVYISSSDLKIVREILVNYPESYCFGSRVTGGHKEFSDLDICIVSPPHISGHTLSELREAFEQSDLPFIVDLSEFASLPEFMKEKIRKQKVKISEARAALK